MWSLCEVIPLNLKHNVGIRSSNCPFKVFLLMKCPKAKYIQFSEKLMLSLCHYILLQRRKLCLYLLNIFESLKRPGHTIKKAFNNDL